jgi:hypothetical protein
LHPTKAQLGTTQRRQQHLLTNPPPGRYCSLGPLKQRHGRKGLWLMFERAGARIPKTLTLRLTRFCPRPPRRNTILDRAGDRWPAVALIA